MLQKLVLDGKGSRGKTQVRKPACSWLHTRRGACFVQHLNNVSKSLNCFGAGLRNGSPDVLASWNVSVYVRSDANQAGIWFGMNGKKPSFLSWERRFFLLVFTNALAIRASKKGGKRKHEVESF